MTIKVLIVDDSALMRKIISDAVKKMDGIEVAGIAADGEKALKAIPDQRPDIITMDIEMPILDGLAALKIVKQLFDIPVIMLSSKTGRETTIRALELGATDFIEKPKNISGNFEGFKNELGQKIKGIYEEKNQKKTEVHTKSAAKTALLRQNQKIGAIVIGASTGGPRALLQLIKYIPENLSIPIFIVQHMPAGFTSSFAKRLNDEALVSVQEVTEDKRIESGKVYLAPGGYHMTLQDGFVRLDERERIHGVRPAVDPLFETAAQFYKNSLCGIILTGMGHDGTRGMKAIKSNGGYTIAQDQSSSVVFGMPGSAVKEKIIDDVGNIDEIGQVLKKIIKER